MENQNNENISDPQPTAMDTDSPQTERTPSPEGMTTRSSKNALQSNWRNKYNISRPPAHSLPTKFVQDAEKTSTIPPPENVLTVSNQNSITKSENVLTASDQTITKSENSEDFEVIGNSLTENNLPNPQNDEKNLRIIIKIYREKMKAKLRVYNVINQWATYHKEVVEELTSESFMQMHSLKIHDLEMLSEELKHEFNYILDFQQLSFTSLEITCRTIGGRFRKCFFKNLFDILNAENFEEIDLHATAMRNRMIASELSSLQTTNNQSSSRSLKTLIYEETNDCFVAIEKVMDAMKNFKKLMEDRFKYSECFSDSKLDGYIVEAMNASLNKCVDQPVLPERLFAMEICDTFIKPQFLTLNKQNQICEKELILKLLKNYYKKEMEYFLPVNSFRRESDVRNLHTKLIDDITDVLSTKFDTSRNNLDLGLLLLELNNEFEMHYIIHNEIKMQEAINAIKNIVSNLEIEFCEILSKTIAEDVVSDNEFEVLHQKTKHYIENKLLDKINSLCPEEAKNGRYFNWLSHLTQGHSCRLKTKNVSRVFEREKEGVPGPILVIQFGTTHLSIAIQHEGRKELENIHIGNLPEIRNVVTFLKNNQLLVGFTSPNKMYQVCTENILMDPKSLSELRFKNDQILPVNLKFISSCIFTHLKEICEAHSQSTLKTVVITVPLWFGSYQRQDIKDAAKIAGFKQSFLINDISALALHTFSQTQDFDPGEKKRKQHLMVIAVEAQASYSAVYSSSDDGTVSMVTNYGQCHLPEEKSIFSSPDLVHIAVIKNTLKLQPAKKIKFAIIICRSDIIKSQCEKELLSYKGIKFLFHDGGILKGGGEYAKNLMEEICLAKNSVQDKTFYDLCINDESVINRKVVNRLTNCMSPACNPNTPTEYNIPQKSEKLEIYENSCREIRPVERIQGIAGQSVKINFFTNHEGVYSVSSFPGTLSSKNSRQIDIERYNKLIVNNFTPDKELESLKQELQATADYILQNIQKVSGVFREDTEIDAKNAILLLGRCQDEDISKEKINEALKGLKIVEKQIT